MNKRLYDGFHKIEEVESEMKGKIVKREKVILPSAVGGLVIDEANKIALVTQYRPTVGLTTKEIPAGILDKDLSNKDTLLEELEEECEIKTEDILSFEQQPFNHYFMVTGSSDAEMYLYTIYVKRQEDKIIKDDQDVESVEWVTLEQFKDYIDAFKVVDSKSLLAYHQAVKVLKQKK